jgi:hypothetical protein
VSKIAFFNVNFYYGGLSMNEDKALLKKDLILVLKLNSKLNYGNIDEVQKTYDEITEQNLLTTSVGKRYLEKLKQILNGTDSYSCMFCNAQTTQESIICKECLAKFQHPASNENTKQKADNVPTELVASEKSEVKDNHTDNTEAATDAKNNGGKKVDKKKIAIGVAALIVVIAIISAIGLSKIFTALFVVSLGVLIYKCVKKKPKRNAIIAVVVFLVLAGVAEMFSGGSGDDLLAYLGTSQEKVFKEYEQANFYTQNGLLTNENKAETGKAYITLSNGKVVDIVIQSGMYSSYNVAGVHIGDDYSTIAKAMKKKKAVYDTSYSIQGSLETYRFTYDGYDVQVIFKMSGSMVDRISVTGTK